jgi:mannose-6-phosphate isomerase-like protein (cupin superfamily)
MKKSIKPRFFLITLLAIFLFSNFSYAMKEQNMNTPATVMPQLMEKAKANSNWKVAFATAKHGQIVFMNITPDTNPKNEIGMETHPFDQVIIIAEGNGKADLNGKISTVNPGHMIFIPQGTNHNVINLNQDKPLKIMSFYSSNDMPANTAYKTKADEPHE